MFVLTKAWTLIWIVIGACPQWRIYGQSSCRSLPLFYWPFTINLQCRAQWYCWVNVVLIVVKLLIEHGSVEFSETCSNDGLSILEALVSFVLFVDEFDDEDFLNTDLIMFIKTAFVPVFNRCGDNCLVRLFIFDNNRLKYSCQVYGWLIITLVGELLRELGVGLCGKYCWQRFVSM